LRIGCPEKPSNLTNALNSVQSVRNQRRMS
jgi:hypothetical protein